MANIDDIKRRAKKGKVDACLQLLQYFAQGSNGVSKDTFEAKKWGQRAISSWSVKDRQQVDLQDYQYTLKQASNGNPEACLLMASYYGTGTNNVLKNGSKANAWIEKAIGYYANSSFSPSSSSSSANYDTMSTDELTNLANNGNVKACLRLADIYTKGNSQVFADKTLAKHWLDIAESIQPGVTKNYSTSSNNDDINTPYSGSAEEEEKYSDEYESDESEDDSDDNEEETDDVMCHFDKTEFLNDWHKNQIKFEP